jgi:hypothetical protein
VNARRWCATLSLSFGAVSCDGAPAASRVPPDSEFLLAAGDSTYWVTSGASGARVRSAPILLTQIDGQFFEIFIADDGVDYEDAGFAVSRVFSRNVNLQDSVLLFDEGSVMREATAWKQRHPDESPVNPDDEPLPADPATMVSEEIEVVDVHGPWVTINHLLDIDIADNTPHRHVGKRHVIDVRTGTTGTLDVLFGADEARRLVEAGRRSFQQLTDSIRRTSDDRAEVARETLDSFRFDATSFGLANIARQPAVAFMVPGNGIDGEALALNLPPIQARAPDWWTVVAPTLPMWARDSSSLRWTRSRVAVVARPNEDGDALAVALRVGAAGTDSTEWPVTTVRAPAFQLIPLDTPALPASMRAALARAFDASSTLGGEAQVASLPTRPLHGRARFPRTSLPTLHVKSTRHE